MTIADQMTDDQRSEIESAIDYAHRHFCGHADYPDTNLLPQRNKLQNGVVNNYLKMYSIDAVDLVLRRILELL